MPPRDVAPGTKPVRVRVKIKPPAAVPALQPIKQAAKAQTQGGAAVVKAKQQATRQVQQIQASVPNPQAPEHPINMQPTGLHYTSIAYTPHNKPDAIHRAVAAAKAPALQILEQTTRPIHGIAGAADAALTGHNVIHAAGQGLLHNKPYSFSTVLKHAGAPKFVQKVGGFTGDVVFDPSTYVAFGAGSVASHAAADEAARVAAKAAKAGMSEAGARAVAERAGHVAAAAAKEGKGVTVKLAGRELPGIRRGTATVSRGGKRVVQRAPNAVKGAAGGVREATREVRPQLAPAGASKTAYQSARESARQSRSFVNQHIARSEAEARGIRKQIGPDNYATVIDALEKRKIASLPTELRDPAVAMRSSYRYAKRLRARAGIPEGTVRDYFPHAQDTPLKQGLGVIGSDTEKPAFSGTLRKPGSSKVRTDKRPISEQNPERIAQGKEPFSTDAPLVHLNYGRQTARAVGAGKLEQDLAATGRQLHPGRENTIKPGEGIYHLGFSGGGKTSHVVGKTKTGRDVVIRGESTPGVYKLREVQPADWEKGNIPKTGKFVALDRKTVESARQYGKPTQAGADESVYLRGLDKVTRGFKGIATATPGFHARNLVGDVQLGYLNQPGHRIPGNLAAGYKATRVLNAQRKHLENLALGTHETGKTVKVAGKPMKVTDFLGLAKQHGVIQSGYITRELHDLAGMEAQGVKRVRKLPRITNVGFARFLTQDRENMVRLATFKHGLDKGMVPAKAASHSLEPHIDYADLTEFERKFARRLMPFYTFSARALPFQAKRLVTNPGKFANIEKAREQVGGTDVSGYSTYQQRQVPFTVDGKGVTDSLPLVLLNEIPTTASPGKYGTELGQFVANLVNPVLKDPVEVYANKSFAFRNNIQDPAHPLVSAPGWVGVIPADLRKKLGIVQGPDKRSGKQVWMWPGMVDYKVRAFMLGPFNAANQVGAGANRLGQNQAQKAASFVTGVRVAQQDKPTQTINRLYTQLNKLTEKQAALNQQGVTAKNATPEYRQLNAQMKQLERQIYQASKARGDKKLPKTGAPPRPRVRNPGVGGGLGGGLGGGVGGGLG